jgi:hypothetical protein
MKENIMALTTFSGPVSSLNGFIGGTATDPIVVTTADNINESYATTTSERTIKTNQFRLQEERAAQARSLAEYKDKLETNRIILKAKLDSGQYELVQQNGQDFLMPKKELNEVEGVKNQEGRTKTEAQQKAEAKQEEIERSRNEQTVKSMFNLILKAHENGDMSDEEFFSITNDMGMSERWIRQHPKAYTNFGFPKESDTPAERRRKIANFNSLTVNEMSPMSISEITAGFKNWVIKKNKLSGYDNDGDYQNVVKNFNNLEDIGEGLYAKRELKVKRAEETSRLLDKQMGTQMGKYLFDSDGNMRDEKTMIQMMVNDKLLLNDKGEVIKPGEY